MNWEYLITPWQVYYNEKKWWDRFKIDNQNKISYKAWEKIESFEDMIFSIDFQKKIKDAFNELWELEDEKGNLMIFKNSNWDNIYIYNTKSPITDFDNEITYSNMLFEDRKDQILHKTEDLCSFVLDWNIDNISKLAKLLTIKSKTDFLQNIASPKFIDKFLTEVDEKWMEDIFMLWKWCHIGYYWKLYLYAFLEVWGKLIPIYFNEDNLANFDISNEISYEKIEVIIKLDWKEKISLFGDKILNNIMLFNKDVITETELQEYYNDLLSKNNNYTKKE